MFKYKTSLYYYRANCELSKHGNDNPKSEQIIMYIFIYILTTSGDIDESTYTLKKITYNS